jgi:uncharacterized repeat protein (TIGR01451 family)
VEAKTDAAGRASVEVSPVGAGGGATNVGVSIYRPAVGGPGGTAPLGLGRGSATITWGAGAPALPPETPPAISSPAPPATVDPYAPGAPPPYTPIQPSAPPPGSSPLPISPPPIQPNPVAPPPDRYTPPAGESATGRARLEIDVQSETPSQLTIGEYAKFVIVISNRGNATARRVIINAEFPPGLQHPGKPGETKIAFDPVPAIDILPNESKTVPLTFEVMAEGQHCHTVTVTADGAESVSKQGCVRGIKPTFESFKIIGPESRTVGEKAEFRIVIKNGNLPAQNVAVRLTFDPALEPIVPSDPSYEVLQNGDILLKVGDVVANEQRTFPPPAIEARCRSDKDNACVQADLMVGGAFALTHQSCVSILPAAPAGTGTFAP